MRRDGDEQQESKSGRCCGSLLLGIDANIKANAKLIVVLTRVRQEMQGLTEKIQRLNEEKAPLHLSEATVHTLLTTITELLENNSQAWHALSEACIAYHECQRARIGAGRW
ncbi:hypothetical protein F4054_01105 [Candidatus Poribacteria bacterium]|nr:hypothetical protein [Candidatus Poribacteria bacterium]MYG08319.1 hypothetical protein [Candidatus Poribacteria bacterium]MYK20839.1 hypothetical protein [Candidatus Poribacteria bacterium]